MWHQLHCKASPSSSVLHGFKGILFIPFKVNRFLLHYSVIFSIYLHIYFLLDFLDNQLLVALESLQFPYRQDLPPNLIPYPCIGYEYLSFHKFQGLAAGDFFGLKLLHHAFPSSFNLIWLSWIFPSTRWGFNFLIASYLFTMTTILFMSI